MPPLSLIQLSALRQAGTQALSCSIQKETFCSTQEETGFLDGFTQAGAQKDNRWFVY